MSEVRQKTDKTCGICIDKCRRVVLGLLNGALLLRPPLNCVS